MVPLPHIVGRQGLPQSGIVATPTHQMTGDKILQRLQPPILAPHLPPSEPLYYSAQPLVPHLFRLPGQWTKDAEQDKHLV